MQAFYEHWLQNPFRPSSNFPYDISLGENDVGEPLLQFHPYDTADSKIMITEAYDRIFHRILDLRQTDPDTQGVVITGQPGIGES